MVVALTKSDAKHISALFQRTGAASNMLDKRYLALIGLGHVKTLDQLQETHLRTIKNSLCNDGDGRMSLWREELQQEGYKKCKKLKAVSESEPLATSVRTPQLPSLYPAFSPDLHVSQPTHPIALVRLKLITGVKHQLRLHMAHALGSERLSGSSTHALTHPSPSPNSRRQSPLSDQPASYIISAYHGCHIGGNIPPLPPHFLRGAPTCFPFLTLGYLRLHSDYPAPLSPQRGHSHMSPANVSLEN